MINVTWRDLFPENFYFGRHRLCPNVEFNLPYMCEPIMVPATVLQSQVTERPAFERGQSRGETKPLMYTSTSKYKVKVSNRERIGESVKGF